MFNLLQGRSLVRNGSFLDCNKAREIIEVCVFSLYSCHNIMLATISVCILLSDPILMCLVILFLSEVSVAFNNSDVTV